jgi:alpha-galactosidase
MKKIFSGILLIITISAYSQKFDRLAQTPPMGWNSWNKFGCDVSENMIKEIADALVSSGMKDAGYEYIIVDDCWHGKRDSLGFIHPDPTRFPSGIKALADYIHSKGLKFGIYSDAGSQTCGGRPGSRGHEYQDAIIYAKWGVDYLKYDWCNTDNINPKGAYTTISNALFAAGRPVILSMCEWGTSKPWEWAADIGYLWRTTGDIYPCFDCVVNHGNYSDWGVLRNLNKQKDLRQYAGPGHWNDPDMLEVGNGMNVNEDRAHFSLWCIVAAPMIAGNDVRQMSQQTHDILTNREAIAIDQDSLGIQGFQFSNTDSLELWVKPLKNDAWALCFLNRSNTLKKINYNWKNIVINDSLIHKVLRFDAGKYKIHNIWTKTDQGSTAKPLVADLPGHDVIFIRLSLN